MSVPCEHTVPAQASRAYQMPWNWSYRLLAGIYHVCWEPKVGPMEKRPVLVKC